MLSVLLSGCGGDFNAETGTFTSPGYPGPYPHNRECIWRITVPIGKRIQLDINNVNLEYHSNCTYDFIEVNNNGSWWNLANSDLQLVGGYVVRIENEKTQHHTISVKVGCWASAENVCKVLLFFVRSCILKITKRIYCFVIINTDKCASEHFSYFPFKVLGGPDANSPLLTKICQNRNQSSSVTSTGNQMYVRFKTDASSAGTGFTANFSSVEQGKWCPFGQWYKVILFAPD